MVFSTTAKGALFRAQEAREASRRLAGERASDLIRLNVEHHNAASNHAVLEKSEDHRRMREARERQAEIAMYEQVEQMRRDAENKARAADQNARITAELARRTAEKERHERFVQKVHKESEELRDLGAKLAAAETTYERRLQLDEKALLAQREAQYNAAIDAKLAEERQRLDAIEQEQEAERRRMAIIARRHLEQQMDDRQESVMRAQEAAALEREQIDQLAKQILAEDARAREERRLQREATRDYVAQFLEEHKEMQARKRALEEEEDRKIAAYRAAVEARTAGVAAKKKAKAEEEMRIFALLAAEAAEASARREAMDELISRLHFEEEEERRRKAAEEKARRAAASKQEMILANDRQRAAKAARLEREREEEDAFRAYMLDKFAEDDRVEQMNAARSRMRKLEHKKEVERLAAIKRAMYEEQRVREMQEAAGEAQREAQVAAIVEQERQRMLRDHAARLAEFLPKGVLVNPGDLEIIQNASAAAAAKGVRLTSTTRLGSAAVASRR